MPCKIKPTGKSVLPSPGLFGLVLTILLFVATFQGCISEKIAPNQNTTNSTQSLNSSKPQNATIPKPPAHQNNSTALTQYLHVAINVLPQNNSTALIFNITRDQNSFSLGSVSGGKSSARLIVLTNELDSPVYMYFNSSGNISGFMEMPSPITMQKIGETHEIFIKASVPLNATPGYYEGNFSFTEIRNST